MNNSKPFEPNFKQKYVIIIVHNVLISLMIIISKLLKYQGLS